MKKFFKSILRAFSEVDWANVPKAVYVRYILAFIAIVNSVLVGFGLHPLNIAENDVYMVVSVIFSILVIIVNTYKDNPTSKEGIMSASIRNMLKEIKGYFKKKVIANAAGFSVEDFVILSENFRTKIRRFAFLIVFYHFFVHK